MIGVFDSGIGGVTIFKEIIKRLPKQDYIYYSDSANNPYGDFSKEELFCVVCKVVDYLISHECRVIVIACNTASTVVSLLRKKYEDIVFVATEPAYKLVHDYAYNDDTLVLATKGTIESDKFNSLFTKYDNHKTVLFSCVGLAELIENNNRDKIDEYLKNNISRFIGVKNVVLGCTHYPLIKDNIKKILGDVVFFDSSKGVSLELERNVKNLGLLNNGSGEVYFVDSSVSKIKEKRFFDILKMDI